MFCVDVSAGGRTRTLGSTDPKTDQAAALFTRKRSAHYSSEHRCFVSGALDLLLPPFISPFTLLVLCTPPSLPNKLTSVSTTLSFLFLQQWQEQCGHPVHRPARTHASTQLPFCRPAYQRAGRPLSGPVPDGLGQQCVLGLCPLKRGAFHRRGLLFDTVTVCF